MAHVRVIENKDEDKSLGDWVKDLYNIDQITDEEIKLWYEAYQYKGFDKGQVLKELRDKVGDVKLVQQIIMVTGLLGPQRASQVKLINGRVISSYGVPASGLKGSRGVSCQRIAAATADLCAYFLKKSGVPKRLHMDCPAWLQFPSAGSIKLPDDLRIAHLEFSKRFSTVIGGAFNEQIYQQMMNNAYLDPKLKLFDDHIPQGVLPTMVNLPPTAPVFNPSIGSVGKPKTPNTDKNKPT